MSPLFLFSLCWPRLTGSWWGSSLTLNRWVANDAATFHGYNNGTLDYKSSPLPRLQCDVSRREQNIILYPGSVCLSTHLSVCVCLLICLCVYVYLSTNLFAYVYLSTNLCMSVDHFVCLSTIVCVCLFVCHSVIICLLLSVYYSAFGCLLLRLSITL